MFAAGNKAGAISIHALLAESDAQKRYHGSPAADFYPRSPCGERLVGHLLHAGVGWISIHALLAESDLRTPPQGSRSRIFLSTLSLRRATHGVRIAKIDLAFLSTLSLRRATRHCVFCRALQNISIHALLAESDSRTGSSWAAWFQFLSTLSLRRATPCNSRLRLTVSYFYPRSPCGERPNQIEADRRNLAFLSTLSLRRATPLMQCWGRPP